MTYRPCKIISGGQTGADQAGLSAAKVLGIKTGGWAPAGWITEEGAARWLESFGLKTFGRGYPPRTRLNVRDSDATVLFGNTKSSGTRLTLRLCRELEKPWICNPTPRELRAWCNLHNVHTLNVAGNRERTNPGIGEKVLQTLLEAFG